MATRATLDNLPPHAIRFLKGPDYNGATFFPSARESILKFKEQLVQKVHSL